MNGETLTATKDGGKVVLSDASGGKATIVEGDQQRSNGVVQYVDAVLMPSARGRRGEEVSARLHQAASKRPNARYKRSDTGIFRGLRRA